MSIALRCLTISARRDANWGCSSILVIGQESNTNASFLENMNPPISVSENFVSFRVFSGQKMTLLCRARQTTHVEDLRSLKF